MSAEILLEDVVVPPLESPKERLDSRGNGFGTCLSCNRHRRLWSHICAYCGEACE